MVRYIQVKVGKAQRPDATTLNNSETNVAAGGMITSRQEVVWA